MCVISDDSTLCLDRGAMTTLFIVLPAVDSNQEDTGLKPAARQGIKILDTNHLQLSKELESWIRYSRRQLEIELDGTVLSGDNMALIPPSAPHDHLLCSEVINTRRLNFHFVSRLA